VRIDNDNKITVLEGLIKSKQVKSSQEANVNEKKNGDFLDKVELTSRQEEIDRIKERVKAVPDIREDKVQDIRQALETKTYNIRGELVAKNLLASHLLDEIL